jgi:hypothetical protein
LWRVQQERAQQSELVAESSRQHIAELDAQLAHLQVSSFNFVLCLQLSSSFTVPQTAAAGRLSSSPFLFLSHKVLQLDNCLHRHGLQTQSAQESAL